MLHTDILRCSSSLRCERGCQAVQEKGHQARFCIRKLYMFFTALWTSSHVPKCHLRRPAILKCYQAWSGLVLATDSCSALESYHLSSHRSAICNAKQHKADCIKSGLVLAISAGTPSICGRGVARACIRGEANVKQSARCNLWNGE